MLSMFHGSVMVAGAVVDSVSYGSGDARHVVACIRTTYNTIACMRRGLAFLSEEYGNISILRIGKLKLNKKSAFTK